MRIDRRACAKERSVAWAAVARCGSLRICKNKSGGTAPHSIFASRARRASQRLGWRGGFVRTRSSSGSYVGLLIAKTLDELLDVIESEFTADGEDLAFGGSPQRTGGVSKGLQFRIVVGLIA